MANRNSNRGFGSMDSDRHREISSRGGRASQGNRDGWQSWDDDDYNSRGGYRSGYDRDYNADYDQDYDPRGSYRDYDEEFESNYGRRGGQYRSERDYEDGRNANRGHGAGSDSGGWREGSSYGSRSSWDGRNDDYGYQGSRGNTGGYNRDEDYDYNRGRGRSATNGQGFASWDRDELRRTAAEGGRASHGGRGRDYESDYDSDRRSEWGRSNGSSRQNRDWDDEDRGSSRGNSRRGFAGMEPEERRRISAMGGRTSHGGGRRSDRD